MPKVPAFPNVESSIREYSITSGQTYREGALVVLANGLITECGANPSTILGVALHDAGADPFPTKQLVAVAEPESTFWFQGDRDPVETDEGVRYGVTKDSDGIWYVDTSKTLTNARVEVVKVDLDRQLFEVQILAANRQRA